MGKLRKKIRKRFDYNKDGKVNFKDFLLKLENIVDLDDNGHIDIDELINVVEKTVEVAQVVKSGV